MITVFLIIMAVLALGIMVVMFASFGYWLLIGAIVFILAKSLIKSSTKLVDAIKKKKDDTVIMSRKDFEANYVKKS